MFEIYKRPDHTEVIKNIIVGWKDLGLPDADLSKLSCTIIPPRKEGFNSLMSFMMSLDGEPLIFIKTLKYSESSLACDSLRNEAETLKELSKMSGSNYNVPRLHLFSVIAGLPVMITGAIRGRMFNEMLDEETDPEKLDLLLTRGASLCLDFAKIKSRETITADEDFIEKNIRSPLRQICEYFPQYLGLIEQSAQRVLNVFSVSKKKISKCLAHNDFNPWNIMISKDEKAWVIDWEDASFNGFPLMDLFSYYTIANRILFTGESLYTGSRTPIEKKQRVEVLIKNYRTNVRAYCASAGVPEEAVDFFYLVFAANMSAYFLAEKSQRVSYADAWISMLLNISGTDCFESFVRNYAGV